MQSPPPRKPATPRVVGIPLALLIGLVLSEAGLQVAARIAQRGIERGEFGQGAAIACYGDSNVFGLYEPAARAYPGQLEVLANTSASRATSVVNRGLPGLATRQVIARLTEDLEHARPAAVLLTAGVNNRWKWTGDPHLATASPPWHERLRVAQLVRLLVAAREPEPEQGAYESSVDPLTGQQSARAVGREGEVWLYERSDDAHDDAEFLLTIRNDLERVAALLNASGIPLFVVTYGADRGLYATVNAELRDAAREFDVALIDVTPSVTALAGVLGNERVYYPDLHPRGIGYEAIARTVHDRLVEEGLLDGPPVGPVSVAALDDAPRSIQLVRTNDAGQLEVQIEGGTPGREFSLALWGLRSASASAARPSFADAGPADPLLAATLQNPELAGRFDHNGRARIPLGAVVGDTTALEGKVVRACYIEYTAGRLGIARYSIEEELPLPANGSE